IMPQKKNPDVLELIRGKTARVMGAVSQLLVLVKGLPLAYNRDLQEDKLAMFDAHDTVIACLQLAPHIVANARLNVDRINARLEDGYLDATALMEYLISKGVPMRTGHGTVGKLVALCESRSCRLAQLSLDELQEACELIDDDVYSILGTRNAVAALSSYGSGGREPVMNQLAAWRTKLGM
ncbi:MAG: argininosuccinate lyase, partial [Maioricimonas sp. JB049]